MILITGGTGFLGSHLAVRLIGQGDKVVFIARPKRGVSPENRIARLLDWHGVVQDQKAAFLVVEGRLEEPDLGLSPDAVRELQGVEEIVHCASDTSFAERKRAEVEAANINGLDHLLGLALRTGCRRFHLVSTAYVAGISAGVCAEEISHPAAFTNVYEETKCRAEWLATERCSQAGIPLFVYRPSIVYGHSQTGRSLAFNALYHPVRIALFLRNLFDKDIREKDGRRSAELGVRSEGNGRMVMPIRIGYKEGGGVNLVPVDFFVDAFTAIREDGRAAGVFHLVNERLTRIEDIIAWTQDLFHIQGIEARPAEELADRPRSPLEKIFDSYLEAYGPYLEDRRVFETSRAGPILEYAGVRCPEFNWEVFSRCMAFAVESGWGSRLFRE